MSEYRELVEAVRAFSEERGWTPLQTPKNLAMAICGEAGELAAELQWVEGEGSLAQLEAEPELRQRVADEMADVLIYLTRLESVTEIDLVTAAHDKLARNRERFPVGTVLGPRGGAGVLGALGSASGTWVDSAHEAHAPHGVHGLNGAGVVVGAAGGADEVYSVNGAHEASVVAGGHEGGEAYEHQPYGSHEPQPHEHGAHARRGGRHARAGEGEPAGEAGAAVVVGEGVPVEVSSAAEADAAPGGDDKGEMQVATDIARLTTTALEAARHHPHGRHAELLVHDGELRQTLIALAAGSVLGEHNSPHAATILVMRGRVRVMAGEQVRAELEEGELWLLTHERHGVVAVGDAVFLLTTVTGVGEGSYR